MIFFFRSIFVQTFLNAFVVYRIGKSKDLSKSWKYTFIIIYILETLMYFAGLFAMHRLPVETVGMIQKISGVWVIFQVYLVALILSFDLIIYLKRYFIFFYRFTKKQIKRARIICFVCINILIWISFILSYHNFTNPVIKNYDFSFNRKTENQTAPVQTYKMLIAADLHLGYIVDKQMLDKYVKLINDQHADIVVIDGDLIDWDLYPLIKTGMQHDLKRIKAPKGVYFIPGNHEYKFDSENKLAWISQSGMTVLKDTIISIDDKLWLIGRDDKDNEKRKPIAELMKGFDTSKPCIMLAHQPANIKEACEYHIPLTICGHTHCGQIFPANLLSSFLYSNPYGMKTKDNCSSCTTSGLGLSGFPLRSGSHCEAIVFEIKIY